VTEFSDGFVEPALQAQGIGQIEAGAGEAGIELEGAAVVNDRFVGASEGEARFTEIRMGGGILRLEGEGLLDETNGVGMLSGGVGEHAEQMQGAGVLRLDGEDLAVESFRFAEPAGLVMLHGDLKGALDRD
jgi:hypothetical protein